MDRLRKYMTSTFLTAALLIPGAMAVRAAVPQVDTATPHQAAVDAKKNEKAAKADEKAAKDNKKLRIYDAKHNIYHDWTPQEDTTYRSYLEQQHEQYRAYQQLNADQQAAYWNWRASHSDVPAPATVPNGY